MQGGVRDLLPPGEGRALPGTKHMSEISSETLGLPEQLHPSVRTLFDTYSTNTELVNDKTCEQV